MTTFAPIPCLQGEASVHGRAHHDFASKSLLPLTAVFAASATAVSLGIATCGGWQRGGTLTEQVMSVALGGVAVLYVHLLPMRWNAFHALSRAATFVLWCVSVVVVLYGQVAFFMVSQQHAGNLRAATVPAPVVRPSMNLPPGRTLTEIAVDTAKVGADLARVEARRCTADCPALKARKTILAAQLAALNTEAGEVRRREAEEDRLTAQADQTETLRATLRADPVASTVASWFGTTERRLELMLAVACAVVLEGAAIVGWLLVAITTRQACGHETGGSGRKGDLPKHDAVASEPSTVASARTHVPDDRMAHVDGPLAVALDQAVPGAESSGRVVLSEDEHLLAKIHEAVVTGQIKATQESIRTFLRCGQPKAGNLNRQYLARFGRVANKGNNTENAVGAQPDAASSHVPPLIAHAQQEPNVHAQAGALPAMADA
ncbi:hypothetical protein [Ralstonia flatus]|uniref:Transmembrane protein n=1 Tax=Ralstonia flatus TaxID=3058601 RepID=A0ABN9KFI8_9RALS|nr:hypothetical protein [Ralstonia sp. LMG 32965]MBN6209456.1 hypothetical protein [Ralstonia pickettii]CAJ0893235.1 hypothetical protein R77564_03695 [Ralstonia sp. LMG 32965]